MKKLGILGGGQLGKMLIQAAADYAIECHVLDPEKNPPAGAIAHSVTHASLQDEAAIMAFAKPLDILTIEIENVNTVALKKLTESGKTVYPQPHIIELVKDKGKQKQFYKDHQLPTAPFRLIQSPKELKGTDVGVLKLCIGGYDGKGVMVLDGKKDPQQAFEGACVLEEKVAVDKELSVIVVRSSSGETVVYPVIEMIVNQKANLLDYLLAPAQISKEDALKAQAIARQCSDALGLVGILAVELFLTTDGKILINEIAPRPHNSGHHTIEANQTSQYDQHIRAIMGWPLGSPHTISPAGLWNLLGPEGQSGDAVINGLKDCLAMKGIKPHLYGKQRTTPFRKMGHVTVLADSLNDIKHTIERLKKTVTVSVSSPDIAHLAELTEAVAPSIRNAKINIG